MVQLEPLRGFSFSATTNNSSSSLRNPVLEKEYITALMLPLYLRHGILLAVRVFVVRVNHSVKAKLEADLLVDELSI